MTSLIYFVRRRAALACLITLAAGLAACASETNLIAPGRITLEPRIDRSLRMLPEVTEQNGRLVVSGRVEYSTSGERAGEVVVEVVGPDGRMAFAGHASQNEDATALGSAPGPQSGSFRRVAGRHLHYGAYSFTFPGLPPDGSIVRVRFDRTSAATTH